MSPKYLGKIGFLFLFFFVFSLPAVPIGNPSLPSLIQEGIFIPDTTWCNPQAGFVKDFLFSKRLSPSNTSRRQGLHRALLKGSSQVLVCGWSIRERFNLQIELGSGSYVWHWKEQSNAVLSRSTNGLIWTGNGKIVVLDVKDTSLAADIHAGGWSWMNGYATLNAIAQKKKFRPTLQYWQIGVAITQKIAFFSPYLGIAINHTHVRVKGLAYGLSHLRSRHFTGPFVGCSLSKGSQFLLNFEWRGWFEEGFSVLGQVRF